MSPGVIARLVGLDSLPKLKKGHDSAPILCNRNPDPQISSLIKIPPRDDFEPRYKTSLSVGEPQTENLPQKSAKAISETQNKFHSPVKRAYCVSEAVNETTEMRPQSGKKTIPPQSKSSSATLKLSDSKRKLLASKRQSKPSEDSQRSSRLSPTKKSWNGAASDISSVQSNGKSVSLAVLAKENVRRRAGLAYKEESASDELLMSHLDTRKDSTIERGDSRILRQNDQKQNKIQGRGNSPVKSKSRDGREHRCADSSSTRRRNSSSVVGKSQYDRRKLVSEVEVDKRKEVRHGRQPKDGHHRSVEVITSSSAMLDKESRKNRDVISRTDQRPFSSSDCITPTKLSSSERSIKGGDSSSSMLKHILHRLTTKMANTSQHNSERWPVDFKPESPVSVLEHADSISSCESSDSNRNGGVGQCPSNGDVELSLSDTASSVCNGTSNEKRQETTLTTSEPKGWELEYVEEMLRGIEKAFDDYALGRNSKIVNHHIFDRLEAIPGINARLLFDNVSECVDLRCRFYVHGGFKSWAKAMKFAKEKGALARDVYRELCSLRAMKDLMVDELIDWDMSHCNGRWLCFEDEWLELGVQIESRILDYLIYELVTDFS